MAARLVPYRSLNQVAADANVMMVLMLAGALASRLTIGERNPLNTAVVALTFVVAPLASEIVATWRSRSRGAEQITREKWYELTYSERAAQSIWQVVGQMALATSFAAGVLLLAILPIDEWPDAAVGSAIAAVLGGLSGTYVWATARAWVRATAKGGKPVPTRFFQVAMRHYTGYAAGLAVALFAASYSADRGWAPALVLAAFVAGKVVSDAIVPAVYYNTAAEGPHSIWQLLQSCLFAIVWWGFPLSAVVALANFEAGASWPEIRFAIALTISGAVVGIVLILAILFVTRGRSPQPGPKT